MRSSSARKDEERHASPRSRRERAARDRPEPRGRGAETARGGEGNVRRGLARASIRAAQRARVRVSSVLSYSEPCVTARVEQPNEAQAGGRQGCGRGERVL